LESGAWLPFVQSGVTGLIVFVIVIVIGLASRWRDPLTVAGVIGVIAWGLAWLSHVSHWFTLTRLPSDNQLEPGEEADSNSSLPSRQPPTVKVIVSELRADGSESGQAHYWTFPGTPGQLLELSRGLLEENQPFTERAWTGAGRPYSVNCFRELRGEFIRRGLVCLASQKDQRQGYILSLAGRHVLAGVLAELNKSE
jgi:hypothetical protein